VLVVTGWNSRITQELLRLLPEEEKAHRASSFDVPLTAGRYLFCAGRILPESIAKQSDGQIAETFMVNAGHVIQACDRIFDANAAARVCVVGSESAFTWSFDGAYAAAKAALHRYVETKQLRNPEQQLVCVSPGIIGDAGMTVRRTDRDRVMERMARHPKRRFLESVEVARLVHYCLYVDRGYLSGTVIRMNGGSHIV
jgi:NAD(P)-dependent dehydrogenase (short-subunit alcohol dehydrogenase family)